MALTLLETQLASTAERVGDEDKMVAILTKTVAKMSPTGRAEASGITLGPELARILERAGQAEAS